MFTHRKWQKKKKKRKKERKEKRMAKAEFDLRQSIFRIQMLKLLVSLLEASNRWHLKANSC
jgi:hypothetical protein